MQEQGGATGHLPEDLEFEGRFMSSRPISNNSLWWHHKQNPQQQQLPDFPTTNDTGGSHHNSVVQPGRNADRLDLGQSGSINLKLGGRYSDQLMGSGMTYSDMYDGAGSVSNNLPIHRGSSNESSTHRSNRNVIRPVLVRNPRSENSMRDSHTNLMPSGQAITEHNAMVSSSPYPSILQTGSLFREDNKYRSVSQAVTSHSSDKRKSTEGSSNESSARASKRSVQIAGTSGSQAAPHSHTAGDVLSVSSSSANVFSLASSGALSDTAVPMARSSLFDSPESGSGRTAQNIQEHLQIRTSSILQDSVSDNTVSSGTVIRHNRYPAVQRPLLPLPQRQAVEEGSNIQNHSMSVQHSSIPRDSSKPTLAAGTIQMEEIELRNSTQRLHSLPVLGPPVGSRNLRSNANIPENTVLSSLSNTLPSLPQPVPRIVFNGNSGRQFEQIRQSLLAADSSQGASNPPPQDTSSQSGADSNGNDTLEQRVTLLLPSGRNHSNFGATDPNSLTNSFDSATRQRFLSRARHILAVYHAGRHAHPLEAGVNVRQSLRSTLGSIHDQYRDMRLDVDNMSYEELLALGERIGDVKTGLSEEEIMKCLKHNKYTSTVKSNKPNAEPCSICKEEYAEGEDLGALTCRHEYHTNCIKQWLVLKNICPICKAAASSSK